MGTYQWQANMPHIVEVLLWFCVVSGSVVSSNNEGVNRSLL